MHPRIQEVLAHLDSSDAEFKRAVAAVPPELRDRRPGPNRWSVQEVVEHVSLVEGRVSTMLVDELNRVGEAGLGADQDTSPVLPTFDVARVIDRSHPLVAGEATLPHGNVDTETGMKAFDRHRQALRNAVLAADGLALGAVALPHRIFGQLNLYQWIAFAGSHEARHAGQVREIAESL
jgi:hypothetical protein